MHHIEHGLGPREATIQAMKEVSAPVIGIALILCAVFVPVAFLGGLTGQMYQQFALTIAISVLLSAFSALSLSPALCAMFLKPAHGPGAGPARAPSSAGSTGCSTGRPTATSAVAHLLVRKAVVTILLVAAVAVGAGLFGSALPAGFIPDEDQGLHGVNVQLPPGASLERTGAVLTQVEQILAKTPGVDAFSTIGGYGVVTSTYQPNFGTIFVRLKPWDERKDPALHVKAIMAGLQPQFAKIPEAIIFPFNIPTISGFGASAGFKFLLQDRSGTLSVEQLGAETRQVPGGGAQAARAGQPLHVLRPELSPGQGGARPREGALASACPSTRCSRRCRRCSAAATSTTSTGSAASSASTSRPRPTTGEALGHRRRVRPQPDQRDHDPALDAHDDHVGAEHRDHHPLQPVPVGGGQRGARARLLVRAGPRGARGGLRQDDAEGDGLRVLEPVVPGEGGAARGADLHPRHRVRVPPARRDVRELAAAVGGAARLPAGRARRLLRRVAHGLRQQRLRPDRQHHAHRPRRQERHPDRRVRQGQAGRGHARSRTPRSRPRGCASGPS